MSGAELALVIFTAGMALALVLERLPERFGPRDDEDVIALTLDEAVAVVLDSFVKDDDDIVHTVTINRRTDSTGTYALRARVGTAENHGAAYEYRQHTVHVPDDLDSPIGLPPVVPLNSGISLKDQIGHHHRWPAPGDLVDEVRVGNWYYRSGCCTPECVAAHDRALTAWRSAESGHGDVDAGVQPVTYRRSDLPTPEDPLDPYRSPAPVELVEDSMQRVLQVKHLDLQDPERAPDVVGLDRHRLHGSRVPLDGGLGELDLPASSIEVFGHESSPSVRTAPVPAGPVVGAAALDTPPAGDSTVGDNTDVSGALRPATSVTSPGGDVTPASPSGAGAQP